MASDLPQPLRTAVKRAAHLMAIGHIGGAASGDKYHPYRRDAERNYQEVLAFLRTTLECLKPGLTLRTADSSLFRQKPDDDTLFSLVVCAAGRPERPVKIMQSVDLLYTVTAEGGATAGLVVVRHTPKRAVK